MEALQTRRAAAPDPTAPLPRIDMQFRTWRVAIVATDRHLITGFARSPRFAPTFDIDRGLTEPAEFASPQAAQSVIYALREAGWKTQLWPFEVVWAGENARRLLRILNLVRETSGEAALLELRRQGMGDLALQLAGLEGR